MRYSLAAAGLFALAVPLSAFAQATVTHTNASPQAGTMVLDASSGFSVNAASQHPLDVFGRNVTQLILNDLNAHHISTGHDTADVNFDAVYDNTTTMNRVCALVDSTAREASYADNGYDSEGSGGHGPGNDEWIVQYGSGWSGYDAKSNDNHIGSLECDSYAVPTNTLTANDYSVTSGAAVTLTFDYSAARDVDGDPAADCSATGFTLPKTTSESVCTGGFQQVCTGVPLSLGASGDESQAAAASLALGTGRTCSRQCMGGYHTVTHYPAQAGTVKVYPTTTTTYTYSCTNANGTTKASAKVTVTPKLAATCTASDTTITAGGSETYTANPSGGSGTYTYSWSGSPSISGSAKTETDTYSTAGSATAKVVVTSSDGQSVTATCPTVSVAAAPVNGVCAATHYACTKGTSTSNVNGSTSYTWKCAGTNGGTTASCSEVKLIPDFIAGAVTPTTATAGAATTFKANITNQGNGNAGATTALLQRATNSSGANATDVDTATQSAENAGVTRTISFSYTFASAGTWYLRACADKANASDTDGAIDESNETNNCGNWQKVTVSNPAQPDLTAGAVSPVTATVGEATTLSATVANGGDATTDTTFSDLFEIDNDSSHATLAEVDVKLVDTSMAKLAADAHESTSVQYTFPSAGTWYVRVCADQNASGTGTIDESNETNNCGPGGVWTAVIVDPPAQPDLTAGSVTPTTATAGAQTAFTSSISNSGDATAGASTALLQRATNSSGANATDIDTAPTAAVSSGSSKNAAFSAALSAGTWYLRACADKSSAANTGVIVESNEDNNCGAWKAVTVTTPTLTCSASPTSINQDTGTQTVTYTASPTTASPYHWTGSDGYSPSGTSYTVTRNYSSVSAGIYGMTVSASGYASANCPQVTVTNSCAAAHVTLAASPARVEKDDTAELTWAIPAVAEGVSSCSLTGTDGSTYTIPVSSCKVAGGGGSKDTDPIQGQTTYTLTCGSQTATAIVDVIPSFNEF